MTLSALRRGECYGGPLDGQVELDESSPRFMVSARDAEGRAVLHVYVRRRVCPARWVWWYKGQVGL